MKVKKEKERTESTMESTDADISCTSIAPGKSRYEDKLQFVNKIAKPMATKRLAKKLFKLIKKSSKTKNCLRSGLKAVHLRIRKGERGIMILAGDITPIEIMCHLPAVCEDLKMPYAYVPSKSDIGEAMGVHRPLIVVMVLLHDDYKDLYMECKEEIDKLPSPLQ